MNQTRRRFINGCAVLFATALSIALSGTAQAKQSKWELYEHKNRDMMLNQRANNPDRKLVMYDQRSNRYHTAQKVGLLHGEAVRASLSSDTFIPIVYVYDANGRRLASGNPVSGNHKYKNEIVFVAPTDDEFVVTFTSVNMMAEGGCRIEWQLFRPTKVDTNKVKPRKPDLTKRWANAIEEFNFPEKWYGRSQSNGKTIHVKSLMYKYVDLPWAKGYHWVATGQWGRIQQKRDVSMGEFIFVFDESGTRFDGRWWKHGQTKQTGWIGERVYD